MPIASLSFSSSSSYLQSISSAYSQRRRNVVACKLGGVGRSEVNLYRVLSLDQSQNVGVEEIKRAYRAMALQYHPDVCPPSKREEFTSMFVQAHEAYMTLSDPDLRRRYDLELALGGADHIGASYDKTKMEFNRDVWESQLRELERRSGCRMKKKDGSRGSRIRAKR